MSGLDLLYGYIDQLCAGPLPPDMPDRFLRWMDQQEWGDSPVQVRARVVSAMYLAESRARSGDVDVALSALREVRHELALIDAQMRAVYDALGAKV